MIWKTLIVSPVGRGRKPKTRLGQFLFFIHLLYFTSEPISRAMNTVNKSNELRQVICLGREQLTFQSFHRFLDWLGNGQMDSIHTKVVQFAINKEILNLNHLLTDSGPVYANVNTKKALIFPKKFRRKLFLFFKHLDLSSLEPLEKTFKYRKYSLKYLFKLYLVQILCGIGALTQFYRFLAMYPEISKLIGDSRQFPFYLTLMKFISRLNQDLRLKQEIKSVLPEICKLIAEISPKSLPGKVERLEDLYGVFGTKNARVDRGARINARKINKKQWYGYKDHITVDQEQSMPVLVTTSGANTSDSKEFVNHIRLIKERYDKLITVQTWTADKGYDSESHRKLISVSLSAKPQLCKRKPSKQDKMRQKRWNSHRQPVEHVIGRASLFSRKKHPRVRGRRRVDLWVKMSYFIVLAVGLSLFLAGEPDRIKEISFYLN